MEAVLAARRSCVSRAQPHSGWACPGMGWSAYPMQVQVEGQVTGGWLTESTWVMRHGHTTRCKFYLTWRSYWIEYPECIAFDLLAPKFPMIIISL